MIFRITQSQQQFGNHIADYGKHQTLRDLQSKIKNSYDYHMSYILNGVKEGDIINIKHYNSEFLKIEEVSFNSSRTTINEPTMSFSEILSSLKMDSIDDLKHLNVFKYLGKSRIDDYHMFNIDEKYLKQFIRDSKLIDLGLTDTKIS